MRASKLVLAALSFLMSVGFGTSDIAAADAIMDRYLTAAELKALLPTYIAAVEASATKVLSPDENQAVRILATAADPVLVIRNGRMDGYEGVKPESVILSIESALDDLKRTTPADRQRAADAVLAGFKGTAKSGKVSCQLGYLTYVDPQNRIVVCTDDHGRPGTATDEGFLDVRQFELNIDATTLKPKALIAIDHRLAG